MRQGTLFAQRFDAARGELTGDPVPVADSVAFDSIRQSAGSPYPKRECWPTGRVAALPGHRLAWFDRSGKEVGTLGAPDENGLQNPELSPDGRRVAVDRTVQGNRRRLAD